MVDLNKLKKFISQEDGQTNVEYVLILVLVVTIFMQFRGRFITMLKRLLDGLDKKADEALDDIAIP